MTDDLFEIISSKYWVKPKLKLRYSDHKSILFFLFHYNYRVNSTSPKEVALKECFVRNLSRK